jgi:hypothetical protein
MENFVIAAGEGRTISTSAAFFFGFIGLVFLAVGVAFFFASRGISASLQSKVPRVSYGVAAREGFPGRGFIRTFGAIFLIVGVVILAFSVYDLV